MSVFKLQMYLNRLKGINKIKIYFSKSIEWIYIKYEKKYIKPLFSGFDSFHQIPLFEHIATGMTKAGQPRITFLSCLKPINIYQNLCILGVLSGFNILN